jgi:hypothetical protein
MTLLHINAIVEELHNGHTIFFCKTDYILRALSELANICHDVVLISGNSDYIIDDEVVLKAPANVKKWFCQNKHSHNDILHSIPIGLENLTHLQCVPNHGYAWDHAAPKHKIIASPPDIEASKEIYANFATGTNAAIRNQVAEICSSAKHITCEIVEHHASGSQRDYLNYVTDILDHKMSVCPRGNGPDCHRVWEVLHLNRVPIIQHHISMEDFSELPIVFIDDWHELCDAEHMQEKHEAVKHNSRRMLDINYWIEKNKKD